MAKLCLYYLSQLSGYLALQEKNLNPSVVDLEMIIMQCNSSVNIKTVPFMFVPQA